MIPKECKRLAEVDFPIAEVSKHATREKSIRHGHPSTLHLWWARRPLASSRAVLMALLLPDPCDPHCPGKFKKEARELLLNMWGRPSRWNTTISTDDGLRQALFRFIADFANWDNCSKTEYLETSRGLVKAAHPEETPLVVDPFAGGGSIPLEALRVGCDTFASDLNPVACLILKVMLEDIPRHGSGLADELRKAGVEIKAQAEKELADLYPKDPDGATPIAYLWARTVRCEAPNCGAEIPLMRSMWLCKKPNRKFALRPNVVRNDEVPPRVEFEIFDPKTEREVNSGTVSRAKATCMCCQTVLPPGRVRTQLAAQDGGADTLFDERGNRIGGAQITAVAVLKVDQGGRHYRLPTEADYAAVRLAQKRVDNILAEWESAGRQSLCPVPDEPIHQDNRGNFWVVNYGPTIFGDLFTARQKAALLELGRLISVVLQNRASSEIALLIGRMADFLVSLARWKADAECPVQALARQALPLTWDFAEANPWTEATGSVVSQANRMADAVKSASIRPPHTGQVQPADATSHPLPSESAGVWFTDPPYYDAVAYSGLSDFFYVWLKRTLPEHRLLRDYSGPPTTVTPKERELIVDTRNQARGAHNWNFYEKGMAEAFAEGRRILNEDGVGSVVFAHKTTEGWEALLSGMIRGGWTITGSWPIATESKSRLRARDSAALATSIHLVCRPRPEEAQVGEWATVLRELPIRVGNWMQRLEAEGVRGADLVFACVGPALEIFSRYSKVETAEGHEVALPEYLERVWEVVGREALKQVLGTAEAQARNGAAGALEEDARLTALFLWTLQATTEVPTNGASESDEEDEAPQTRVPGFSLPFDVARRFAQPLGIHMEDWEKRIIQTEKGVVHLRPVKDRAKELFGESGADAMADQIESAAAASAQMSLFPDEAPAVRGRTRARGRAATTQGQQLDTPREATTLDRVHAAMLLQASGRTEALRNLLQGRTGPGPRLPAVGQRPLGPLPQGQRGKAPSGWNAAGSAALKPRNQSPGGEDHVPGPRDPEADNRPSRRIRRKAHHPRPPHRRGAHPGHAGSRRDPGDHPPRVPLPGGR